MLGWCSGRGGGRGCIGWGHILLDAVRIRQKTVGRRTQRPAAGADCCSPLLFILSSGADPMHDLLKFAELMKMSRKMHAISLGQGQGRKAEALIQEGRQGPGW